jgi:hypothetical protein
MTTYNELAGFRVNYLSSDPTLNSGNEGQVWYNSTSGQLKSLVQIKSWAAGGNLSTARRISRSRYSNCRFSFWWFYNSKLQTQKNIMELLGQQVEI